MTSKPLGAVGHPCQSLPGVGVGVGGVQLAEHLHCGSELQACVRFDPDILSIGLYSGAGQEEAPAQSLLKHFNGTTQKLALKHSRLVTFFCAEMGVWSLLCRFKYTEIEKTFWM